MDEEFAAALLDGAVLRGVDQIYAICFTFVAVLKDGTVVSWEIRTSLVKVVM